MLFRKAYITLLELLLVLAIMGIIAGFIGINASRAVREQRFRSEVEIIVDQLRLAQNLMLIFNSNVSVKFVGHKDEGIEYRMEFDTPLPKNWSQELNRPHEKLTTVKQINFEDKLEFEDMVKVVEIKDGISVKFLSGGSRMSRGLMRISTNERDDIQGALTRYVILMGYPAPITTTTDYTGGMELFGKSKDFLQRLTAYTKDELPKTLNENKDDTP